MGRAWHSVADFIPPGSSRSKGRSARRPTPISMPSSAAAGVAEPTRRCGQSSRKGYSTSIRREETSSHTFWAGWVRVRSISRSQTPATAVPPTLSLAAADSFSAIATRSHSVWRSPESPSAPSTLTPITSTRRPGSRGASGIDVTPLPPLGRSPSPWPPYRRPHTLHRPNLPHLRLLPRLQLPHVAHVAALHDHGGAGLR